MTEWRVLVADDDPEMVAMLQRHLEGDGMVVTVADGGAAADFDARSICLLRSTLAYHDGLADFAFAMQGLGSGAIEQDPETAERRAVPEPLR